MCLNHCSKTFNGTNLDSIVTEQVGIKPSVAQTHQRPLDFSTATRKHCTTLLTYKKEANTMKERFRTKESLQGD